MKRAFSLLELIIVILLIIIITTFLITKYDSIFDYTNVTKLKSDLALIRSNISKKISENTLLGIDEQIVLDNSKIDTKNEKLFSNVIDFDLLSTNSTEKRSGSWIKTSATSYEFIISNTKQIKFTYEDGKILCKSNEELCKEIQ